MKRQIKSEINIIPLLDILLILLIIFMIISSTNLNNIEVNLPSSKTSKATSNSKNKIIIEIMNTKFYNIYVDNEKFKKISLEKIETKIKDIIQNKPETIFLIGGDNNIKYGEIIKILDILRKYRVQKIGMLTGSVITQEGNT